MASTARTEGFAAVLMSGLLILNFESILRVPRQSDARERSGDWSTKKRHEPFVTFRAASRAARRRQKIGGVFRVSRYRFRVLAAACSRPVRTTRWGSRFHSAYSLAPARQANWRRHPRRTL